MHTSHVRETRTCNTQYALRWNYETVHVLTKKASCLEKVTRRPLSCQGAPENFHNNFVRKSRESRSLLSVAVQGKCFSSGF